MPNRFEKIAANARDKTNNELHEELSEHIAMSDEELAKLLPTKAEKEKFVQLMGIVHQSTSRNEKIAALADNLEDVGDILLKVLRRVL